MDLYRLSNTTFQPTALVEGYRSLVWTERYSKFGEFVLTSYQIQLHMTALPLYSIVSIRGSIEIMVVENHIVEIDDYGNPYLEISGRSFAAILEQRTIDGGYRTEWNFQRSYTPPEALLAFLYEMVINGSGTSVLRASTTREAANKVTNLSLSDSTTAANLPKTWTVEAGPAVPIMEEILADQDLGIRMVKPRSPQPGGNLVTVSSAGVISRNASTNWIFRLDVYNGTNRTETVVFDNVAGHLSEEKYLFSIKDYKNIAISFSSFGREVVYLSGVSSPSTANLYRRILYFDFGNDTSSPGRVRQRLAKELRDRNQKAFFDGAISPTSPYKYFTDYFLGDMVTVKGRFGTSYTMQVIEYVRIEDENGQQEFPTLIPYVAG